MNLLKVNVAKTKLMCFRNPLKHGFVDKPFFLHGILCDPCTCVPVKWVETTKYMGIFFDHDMSWNNQLAYICRVLRKVACLLYNIRIFVPLHVRKILVYALAYSVLRYGITVFAHSSGQWHAKVNTLLKSVLKSVAYNSIFTDSTNIFSDLEMPNFSSLLRQTVILRYFWTNRFKILHDPSRTLRKTTRFKRPRCFTRYGMRTRDYYVPDIFNDLPEGVFSFDSKTKVKKWLRSFMVDSV